MEAPTFRIRGLAIWLALLGCALPLVMANSARAGDHRPIIYEPVASPAIKCFYSNGQPFAVARTDSAQVLISMDHAQVAREDYVRLWFLYRNLSSQPVLLDPVSSCSLFSLDIKPRKLGDFHARADTTAPTLPSSLLRSISSEKAASEIFQVIGGALGGIAARPTVSQTRGTVGGSGGSMGWSSTTTIDDRSEKTRAIGEATGQQVARTSDAYDMYSQSVSMGVLRKNSVFPGQSINGYIYFKVAQGTNKIDWEHLSQTATLSLPTGTVTVAFLPLRGD